MQAPSSLTNPYAGSTFPFRVPTLPATLPGPQRSEDRCSCHHDYGIARWPWPSQCMTYPPAFSLHIVHSFTVLHDGAPARDRAYWSLWAEDWPPEHAKKPHHHLREFRHWLPAKLIGSKPLCRAFFCEFWHFGGAQISKPRACCCIGAMASLTVHILSPRPPGIRLSAPL